MGKKRPFLVERKAQITIFMILGLLLFFIFLFLIQVAMKVEEIKISAEQEKVLTKAFKKESLRLFVDDCLQDELEQGLILLGKQGTVWADQPGGIKPFSEGINGITTEFNGEPSRIAYAITDETYFEYSNAFPCNEELNSPAFCFYQYPNTLVKFGNRKLFASTFTQDLQQYLLDRTAWCVQSFILSDVSEHAEIIATEIELDLTITNEGIGVKIDYPLKFKVGGEEIFSLSTFDFFYPSRFNQLLDTAASPLRWEQELVDFNYTEETFTQPTFTYGSEQNVAGYCLPEGNYFQCERALALDTYQSLGIDMATENLPNGDDIFTFTPALYEIVNNPQPYSLRIARQNRPPALDYVQRDACPAEGYDYLVIQDDPDRGDINIIPHAIDPDEDRFSISFNSELGTPTGEIIYLPAESVAAISNGPYTVKVTATDEHGKEDSQDVRILVDRPIRVGVSLSFPNSYGVNSYIGGGGEITPLYVVSKEDPILLQATIPAETETANLQTITLTYVDGTHTNNFARLDYNNPGISTEQCYNFPLLREGDASTCVPPSPYDLNLYYNTNDKINRITDPNYYAFHPFQRPTALDNLGILSLNFNTNYCSVPIAEQQSIIEVLVKDCVPLQNPEHPFAFPYEKYKFGLNSDGSTNFNDDQGLEDINPFLATHSCCIGDLTRQDGWIIKPPEGGDCFVNPEVGCYGRITGRTTGNNKGYLLEQEFATCDEGRGNICGGRQGRLPSNDELRCGTNGVNDCQRIADLCQSQLAFGLVETENGDKGWCNGKMGCANFCQTALVYTLDVGGASAPYFAADHINRIAQDNQITVNQEMAGFGFKCGCTNADNGNWCDRGFDGWFTGVCERGQCNDVICTAGQVRCEPDTIRNKQQCNEAGTTWESAGICAADEYCSEGECKPQTCEPKELVCYDGFLDWVEREFPDEMEEIEDAVAENPSIENYPFFCNEKGSEYNGIEAACSSCDSTVTVVEVSDEEWRCGACRQSDVSNPGRSIPAKRCLKDGVRGECTRAGRDRFECRE